MEDIEHDLVKKFHRRCPDCLNENHVKVTSCKNCGHKFEFQTVDTEKLIQKGAKSKEGSNTSKILEKIRRDIVKLYGAGIHACLLFTTVDNPSRQSSGFKAHSPLVKSVLSDKEFSFLDLFTKAVKGTSLKEKSSVETNSLESKTNTGNEVASTLPEQPEKSSVETNYLESKTNTGNEVASTLPEQPAEKTSVENISPESNTKTRNEGASTLPEQPEKSSVETNSLESKTNTGNEVASTLPEQPENNFQESQKTKGIRRVKLLQQPEPKTKKKRFKRDKLPQQQVYYVEKLLKVKTERGKTFYLVKWSGYTEEENTWEPEENFDAALIKQFKDKLN